MAILARGAADLKAAREALAKDGLSVRDYVCDVSKAADITKTHDQIVADFGRIDVLVNNAGTSRTMAFEDISDEAWQEDLDLKLFAAIRFSRLVWAGMKQRKWGRIINVLNTYAKAPAGNSAPTSVSRAAGMALTKVMANEGGEHNILVNAHARRPDHERPMGEAPCEPKRRTWISTNSPKASPRARRSAASAPQKSSPTSPASSPPSKAPTSPAPQSMSTAEGRLWCSAITTRACMVNC